MTPLRSCYIGFSLNTPKLKHATDMSNKNPKIGKALLALVYIITFIAIAYVSITLFVQASSGEGMVSADSQKRPASPYDNIAPYMPDTLSFCGERVPLEYFDVRESLESELIKIMYWHSSTILYLKRANRYFPALRSLLRQNGVPEDFLYLCVCESGMDNVVSPAKAVGFWQILESTGKEGGLEINTEVDERYNYEKSTAVACRYLKQAYERFGSWTLAAASYNCGQNGLQKVLDAQGENSYYDLRLNPETGRYIYRILAFKILMRSPETYGFALCPEDLYPELDTRMVAVDSSITDMYAFGRSQCGNYKILKLLNPWLRDTKLTNRTGKTYYIRVLKDGARQNLYRQQ